MTLESAGDQLPSCPELVLLVVLAVASSMEC